MPRLFLFAITTLLLAACSRERDLREYYFPVRDLTTGRVYVYAAVGQDSLAPEYWYYRGIVQDTAVYLSANRYTPDLRPAQLSREELLNEGMVSRELILYTPDTSGTLLDNRAEILAPSIFPFRLPAGKRPAYVYQARFQLATDPGVIQTLTINRQFDADTTFTFQNEQLSAIRLTLTGELDYNDPRGGSLRPTFSGHEIYARGLGLVEYRRSFAGTEQGFYYRLREIIPMSELERRAREVY
ncbi:MAG: hypothetical protein WBA17_05330 [Saprospiraceae bacterium]